MFTNKPFYAKYPSMDNMMKIEQIIQLAEQRGEPEYAEIMRSATNVPEKKETKERSDPFLVPAPDTQA